MRAKTTARWKKMNILAAQPNIRIFREGKKKDGEKKNAQRGTGEGRKERGKWFLGREKRKDGRQSEEKRARTRCGMKFEKRKNRKKKRKRGEAKNTKESDCCGLGSYARLILQTLSEGEKGGG